MEDTRTLAQLAQEALDVQDACNLSGVVLGWGRAICRLRKLLPNTGTDEINRHYINILWADKANSLAANYQERFSEAYEWAHRTIHEHKQKS